MLKTQLSTFDEFWSAYPRKEDKRKAQELFAKALKEATFEEIMAGLERYKKFRNEHEPWRAWMQPTRWLRNCRWEDEFIQPPKSNGLLPRQILYWQDWIAKGNPVPPDMARILRDNGIQV